MLFQEKLVGVLFNGKFLRLYYWYCDNVLLERVWIANLLHVMHLGNIRGSPSKPSCATRIFDPWKSWTRHDHNFKFGSKLKYLNFIIDVVMD